MDPNRAQFQDRLAIWHANQPGDEPAFYASYLPEWIQIQLTKLREIQSLLGRFNFSQTSKFLALPGWKFLSSGAEGVVLVNTLTRVVAKLVAHRDGDNAGFLETLHLIFANHYTSTVVSNRAKNLSFFPRLWGWEVLGTNISPGSLSVGSVSLLQLLKNELPVNTTRVDWASIEKPYKYVHVIVQTYYEAETLEAYIHRQELLLNTKVKEGLFRRLLAILLNILNKLHKDIGFVHGDLSTTNILVQIDYEAKTNYQKFLELGPMARRFEYNFFDKGNVIRPVFIDLTRSQFYIRNLQLPMLRPELSSWIDSFQYSFIPRIPAIDMRRLGAYLCYNAVIFQRGLETVRLSSRSMEFISAFFSYSPDSITILENTTVENSPDFRRNANTLMAATVYILYFLYNPSSNNNKLKIFNESLNFCVEWNDRIYKTIMEKTPIFEKFSNASLTNLIQYFNSIAD